MKIQFFLTCYGTIHCQRLKQSKQHSLQIQAEAGKGATSLEQSLLTSCSKKPSCRHLFVRTSAKTLATSATCSTKKISFRSASLCSLPLTTLASTVTEVLFCACKVATRGLSLSLTLSELTNQLCYNCHMLTKRAGAKY